MVDICMYIYIYPETNHHPETVIFAMQIPGFMSPTSVRFVKKKKPPAPVGDRRGLRGEEVRHGPGGRNAGDVRRAGEDFPGNLSHSS